MRGVMDEEIGPQTRELLDSLFQIIETLYLEQWAYASVLNERAPNSVTELAYVARNPDLQRAVHERFRPLFERALSIPKLKETVERLVCTPLEAPPKPN